ncbi:endonuclease/exonuclease/phosphatase family protein [Listeria innocua]|uniref:endonuclease/exonuclease/phosphatase family protein n=1 Tax=Listeria TaxID=1637 RepID=UPI000F1F3A1A|nr:MULTISPECIES: endonuclease/exonuclease/phosphatase family protein [Listeria]EAD5868696.1 endonuclease/exonuclease/phosphatase family protein [Listeria innocua]EAF5675667.1 endonuclease/exonuclease/phosphatase family protein [Listeria innocua]EDO1175648.1 endonuclease/exonuclease/phosphatase family protein [Listeria innocua]EHF3600216.1 endonuclease/exonuclease/phosphatase family protein [Listeria innocua]EHF3615172.1 endonuclease/exonuclease/phosphatase family protein [Listeria innocua]
MFSVTTFNIRFDDTSERKKSWELRKTLTKSLLDKYQWDFMGVEEPLLPQMRDMKEMLDWDYFGVGRDDGFEKGEFTAVFYNSARFRLLQEGRFWLSETPDVPSIHSTAMFPRICVWGKFADSDGKQFYIFNTHLDHISEEARLFASQLLLKKAAIIAEDSPIIILGDFNTAPNTTTYNFITKKYQDAQLISQTPIKGPIGSFHDFQPLRPENELEKIDYIFVSKEFRVHSYKTITDQVDGCSASDHFPVTATLEWT